MQQLMLRLLEQLEHRRLLWLGAWLIALAVALPLAARQAEDLSSGGFDAPGSQSNAVTDTAGQHFPKDASRLAVVVHSDARTGAAPRVAVVREVARAAKDIPGVALPSRLERRAARQAADERTTVIPLVVGVSEDRSIEPAKALRTRLRVGEARASGVETHVIGQGGLYAAFSDFSKENLAEAEAIGFPIVLLILVAVFGSFLAASLPIALGFVAVMLTGAVIFLLSQYTDMSVFVTNMASMIGIGVAVDYSLFVLARYRREITAGRSPEEARRRAMSTSGVAVVFSGITVVLSLAGMWLVPSNALRSMALGAIVVVVFAVLAASTLLPLLLKLLGDRATRTNRLFRGRRRASGPASLEEGFWWRWTQRVTRRPLISAALSAGILLVLAIPALSLHPGQAVLHEFPADNELRVGFARAESVVPAGAASPVQVVVRLQEDAGTPAARKAVVDVRRRLLADPEIVRLERPKLSEDRHHVLLNAASRSGPESEATKAAVERLRAGLAATSAPVVASLDVGGASARQLDLKELISGSMWKILIFVLGLSYLVLMFLLRSLLLPLKAVLMNLLSVGASYGVLVVIFQWGWFDGLFGFEHLGVISVFNIPLILAVVFGLSMDYEVFLLSNIRERWEATGDSRRAVAEGLAMSAGTITSAALIMTSVFLVFVFTGLVSIKELGVGDAVAIALDATLVRLVLVPATMELLGRWNWWLPKRLDRALPDVNLERERPIPSIAR